MLCHPHTRMTKAQVQTYGARRIMLMRLSWQTFSLCMRTEGNYHSQAAARSLLLFLRPGTEAKNTTTFQAITYNAHARFLQENGRYST